MSKYRFKRKDEFIRDGLWNNKYDCPEEWSWKGQMNKYLGMDVPDEFNIYCNKKEDFEYNEWYFKSNEYVLKEQQKYFPDLSQHIGRYIRALVDNPHSGSRVYKGDIGKIINKGQVDFPNRKEYNCAPALDKNNLGIKYELLPEDYSPEQEDVPERISFYVKYTKEFTEDLYNALWEWSKNNSEFSPRGFSDSYEGLKRHKFYIFDNWTLNCHGKYGGTSSNKFSYGVDNNKQNCEEEYTIEQVKKLIGYKEPSVEFIPGKWYHFTTMKGKYSLYVKVASVTDKNLFFMNRESISDGYLGEADCIDIKLIENPRLVEDLSEIQEYLPDGHIDKFCESCNGEGETMIAKLYPSGHTEVTDTCPDCNGTGFTNNADKISSDKFKKGEYIVLIGDGQSTGGARLVQSDQFIKNHCYKVRENDTFLRTELDSNGSTTNGWECVPYNPNRFHKTRNWRYATQEEINEYERRGKPYDVTELNKQSLPDEGSIEIKHFPENLIRYLENSDRKSVSGDSSYNKEKVIMAWNKSCYWFCSVESSKPKYSKSYIERIIGQSIYSDSLLETKKQLSMEEIQKECKKRFPIGCTYISTDKRTNILKDDSYTYRILGKNIWAHSGAGYLYENGKWAELVSLPEENITEIPEYVECFIPYGKAIPKKVYKTTDENESNKLFGLSWKQVLIDFGRLENGSFKISNKEAYEQQKTQLELSEKYIIGQDPYEGTITNLFVYDEVAQYPFRTSDYWKEIPKLTEQDFDIYGPTPDIE